MLLPAAGWTFVNWGLVGEPSGMVAGAGDVASAPTVLLLLGTLMTFRRIRYVVERTILGRETS